MGTSSKQNVCSTSNNIKFIMKKLFLLFSILFIFSCQPVEQLDSIVFDNQQLSKFDVFSKTIEIKEIFEKKFSNPYIGHTLEVDPSQRITSWVNDNFKSVGNENIFIVSILDASLLQTQFENTQAKNFDEKINYKYELLYLIEFNLLDDSRNLIATTLVETSRSTTSGIYISIKEKENIINDLIYQSLKDLTLESEKLLKKFMNEYIL